LPPQLASQVPSVEQSNVQPPPMQLNVHWASCWHVITQFPPSQSALQVAWPLQVMTQPPPAQCELQVALPAH
jgi:hypothetical protein